MRTVLGAFAVAGGIALGISSAMATSPLPDGAIRVAQGGSCQGWFSTCSQRCKSSGQQSCVSEVCAPKLAECKQTGCWQESARFGGGKQCGLAK